MGGERGDLWFCGNSTKKCVGVSNSVKNCDKGTPFYSSKFDAHLLDANTSVGVINKENKGNVFDGEDDIHEKNFLKQI